MKQGRISMIKWIRTSRLSIKDLRSVTVTTEADVLFWVLGLGFWVFGLNGFNAESGVTVTTDADVWFGAWIFWFGVLSFGF